MKGHAFAAKAQRRNVNTCPTGTTAGKDAAALAPPSYGIEFVDRTSAPVAVEGSGVLQRRPVEGSVSRGVDRPPDAREARAENRTGMPDQLKDGIESLSSVAMDDVRVHYNSSEPARFQALAYTQGSDIHVAPGQEQHLPHEAWHVVQQMQGMVQPTLKMEDGVPAMGINIDGRLEAEADAMGERATAPGQAAAALGTLESSAVRGAARSPTSPIVQLYVPPAEFVNLIAKLRKQKKGEPVNDLRLFHWNAIGKFDQLYADKDSPSLLAQMAEWNEIPASAGGGPLAPGQLHENAVLPAYLANFSAFTYDLPKKEWGTLKFEKRFDRMTEHGWISTNEVLPRDALNSKKEIVVHMIIAISEAGDDTLECNPHVTIRLKDIQDQLTIISMLNVPTERTAEMKKLGTAAADASMSLGLRAERLKEEAGAPEKLGVDPKALKDAFPLEWVEGVVAAARNAAPKDKATLKLKGA